MTRIAQTLEDLQKHLEEQLHFLKSSADSYDSGYEAEAKRMAVTLRVLLHDHGENSKSLLNQLGKKDSINFYDSALSEKPGMLNMGASLVVLSPTRGDGKATAFFDDAPDATGYVVFDEYWNRPVLYAGNKHFTRKDLVLGVADQDGGAHVDPKLNEEYANLSRNDSFGWKMGTSQSTASVGIVELASIRQIAHEILRTLIPNYPLKNMPSPKGPVMYPRIFFEMPGEEDK